MTVLAVFIGGFGLDCYGINISDDPEVAVFTGDFIECHGGFLLLGMGSSESWVNEGLEFQTTLMYALGEG